MHKLKKISIKLDQPDEPVPKEENEDEMLPLHSGNGNNPQAALRTESIQSLFPTHNILVTLSLDTNSLNPQQYIAGLSDNKPSPILLIIHFAMWFITIFDRVFRGL